MKKFNIKCLLNDTSIQILNSLKDKTINFSSHVFCNYVTSMVELDFKGEKYYICNAATLQEDKDEYPIMELHKRTYFKYIKNFDDTINFSLANTSINHFSLIRDSIQFTRAESKFEVISDIGLKFITDTMDILLIMEDSSGDLINIYLGDKLGLYDSEEELKEQWSFKSEKFELLKREEIQLF